MNVSNGTPEQNNMNPMGQQPMGQQPMGQQPMGQQPMGGYQQMGNIPMGQQMYASLPPKSTLGLVGMILSIFSLICCGPILAIPGIICSIIAMAKTKGEKRATIGLIVGIISIVLWVVLYITGIVSINNLSYTGFDGVTHEIIQNTETDEENNTNKVDENTEYEDPNEGGIIVNEGDFSDYGEDLEEDLEEDFIDDTNTEVENTDENEEYDPSEGYGDDDSNQTPSNEDNKNDGDAETAVSDGNIPSSENTGLEVFDASSLVYNGYILSVGGYTASEMETILECEFDGEDMKTTLEPGYYSYLTYKANEDPDRYIYFYFLNDTNSALPISECKLFKMRFYCSDAYKGDVLSQWYEIDLNSGVDTTSTIDDIRDLFGEADYEYISDEYDTCVLEYWKMYDHEYKVAFEFRGGQMVEVTIGAY